MESIKHADLQRRLQDEVEDLSRENTRLRQYIKNHKSDNETKVNELNRTIKILSSKSDIHSELMQCRHDLQLEILHVENLRRDVESYQSMLINEQGKCEKLKKELLECENSVKISEILQSLRSVPGLSPVRLIEVFSGRIHSLEMELVNNRAKVRDHTGHPEKSQSELYSEEVKRVLARKTVDEFLPSLNNAILVQKILDLEAMIREQDLQIDELVNSSPSKEHLDSDEIPDNTTESCERMLLLTQESLSHARNDIKHLKMQLQDYQDRYTTAIAQLRSLQSTAMCLCCQQKIENPNNSQFESIEGHEDENPNLEQENANLKSLLRERTTQVT